VNFKPKRRYSSSSGSNMNSHRRFRVKSAWRVEDGRKMISCDERGVLSQALPLSLHRSTGMTSAANRRMDFTISACGMPPKLKVVVKVSK
jgi:hypothetical protein